jgi:hypothetical protein
MTIWILAFLLWAALAGLGRQVGAIRMSVSIFGLIVATFLAFKFNHIIRPIMPWFGAQNPVWQWFFPPLIVFGATIFVFGAIAQAVHFKVVVHFKYYSKEDKEYLPWDRLNSQLGMCLGLMMATFYIVLIGVAVYPVGYLAAQFKGQEQTPASVRLLGAMRADLRSSGLEKFVAALDPTPPAFYTAADILGLLFHNPDLGSRLSDYPLFLAINERPEIQEVVADAEFASLFKTNANVFMIIDHARTQGLLKNTDLIAQLKDLDTKDLLVFLRTGKSPKYETEHIVGEWDLDINATIIQLAKKQPNLTVTDRTRLKNMMARFLAGVTFTAAGTGDLFIKADVPDPKAIAAVMAGRNPNAPVNPKAPPPPPPDPNVKAGPRIVARGTWKKEGDNYQIHIEEGGDTTMAVADQRLPAMINAQLTMIFVKAAE